MRHKDGRFSLRPRVLDLGYAYLSGLSFAEIAQPQMETLVRKLNESSSISVLDDTDVVYVVRVPTHRIMTITLAVGTRLPAYATSMGRVLLSQLPADELEEKLPRIKMRKLTPHTLTAKKALREEIAKVAEQGYAMVDQELEQGLRSAAVPIRDAGGNVAALNISVHASRADMDELRKRFLPRCARDRGGDRRRPARPWPRLGWDHAGNEAGREPHARHPVRPRRPRRRPGRALGKRALCGAGPAARARR